MKTPIFDELEKFVLKAPIRFHMPGHKGIYNERFKNISSFFPYDVTELDLTDNLANPKSFIKEGQQLCAKAFGSKQSYFLVNGSTSGIEVMMTACFLPNDYVLVDRNCHLSVINSIILCGLNPIFIYPKYIDDWCIPGGINPSEVLNAFINNPQIKGVIITSPNYYGVCSNLSKISQIAKKHNKIFLVDEAHGAHFCFSEKLPKAALSSGADMCVQSLHKTMN